MTTMSANAHDLIGAHKLLYVQEGNVFADTGYQGVAKREDTEDLDVRWDVALRPGKRPALNRSMLVAGLLDVSEHIKTCIGAKAGHPFRIVKRKFEYPKVRYRGLSKKEHIADQHLVCSGEPVADAAKVLGAARIGASAIHQKALRERKKRRIVAPEIRKLMPRAQMYRNHNWSRGSDTIVNERVLWQLY